MSASPELTREAILRTLDAAPAGRGLTPEVVSALLPRFAATATPDEVRRELDYLKDKGLAEPLPAPLNPKAAPWRITAAGRDLL